MPTVQNKEKGVGLVVVRLFNYGVNSCALLIVKTSDVIFRLVLIQMSLLIRGYINSHINWNEEDIHRAGVGTDRLLSISMLLSILPSIFLSLYLSLLRI